MRQKDSRPICEHCGFDERKDNLSHQLPIGTLLQSQYLIGRVLGQGGFGITYVGWDQHLSIPVAIKEYFPNGVVQRHTTLGTKIWLANGEEPTLFRKHSSRFLNEARVLAQLSDIAEIVQIRNYFSENDTAYIVMEYVQGTTLKEHLKKLGRPMTEAEALAIMEPVLKALQKVHEHGLIHRDISPDNIMIPTGGGIKLIDFGTVRYMDDSGKSKSTESILKPGFAPMEQYNTRGNLGTWTDVYAICATFHYLLTGKVPADVHERLEEGEQLPILRNMPGISGALIDALEKGMQVRVAARIQTIGELYELLYSKQTKPAPQPAASSAVSQKKKRGLIAAFFLVVAVAVAFFLLSTTQKNTPPKVPAEPTQVLSAQQTEAGEAEPGVADLTIRWNGASYRPEEVFGNISGTEEDPVSVYAGNERISDFTVQSEYPEYVEASLTSTGLIRLIQKKSFGGSVVGLTITYQRNDYIFYCSDYTMVQPGESEIQVEYPKSFDERRYTNEELQAMVDADLSLEEVCEKLSTVADAVQYLTLRGFDYKNAGYDLDNTTRFEMNGGDGVGNSALFNELLKGDYEEQGYVYVFYAEHDNLFNYFVIDGVYYFCDFVRSFSDRKESPLYHKTMDPSTLYHSMLSREPIETNNPSSDLYLIALISIRTDREPTRPMTWPSTAPDGKFGHIPLTFAEKESTNILFMRDGYTFEF